MDDQAFAGRYGTGIIAHRTLAGFIELRYFDHMLV
jgi:hypothetical protein